MAQHDQLVVRRQPRVRQLRDACDRFLTDGRQRALRFAGLVDDETSAAFSGRDGSGVGNGVSSPAPSRFDDLVRSTGVPNPFPKRGNRRSKKRGPSYCVFCKNNGEKNQNTDGAMERYAYNK